MRSISLVALSAASAAILVLGGCDRSRQSADGSTQAGSAGTAAMANGTVASTGSPEQGGANGNSPSATPTINQIDRATPDSQASGKANADAEARATGAAGARH